MNARQSLAALAVQNRARRGEGRIGGDATAQGLARDPLDHIGLAQTIGLATVAHQTGDGNPALLRRPQQPGLDRQRQRGFEHLGLSAPAASAQDKRTRAALAFNVEGPGFQTGAAGQATQALGADAAGRQGRRQGVEPGQQELGRVGCGCGLRCGHVEWMTEAVDLCQID
ncbi:hypothetical protein D3C81_1620760 [compost metagenome]